VSPVRYELGFYIAEDGILRGHRRENFKSCILLTAAYVSCINLNSPFKMLINYLALYFILHNIYLYRVSANHNNNGL
jgi:hypothetical protein